MRFLDSFLSLPDFKSPTLEFNGRKLSFSTVRSRLACSDTTLFFSKLVRAPFRCFLVQKSIPNESHIRFPHLFTLCASTKWCERRLFGWLQFCLDVSVAERRASDCSVSSLNSEEQADILASLVSASPRGSTHSPRTSIPSPRGSFCRKGSNLSMASINRDLLNLTRSWTKVSFLTCLVFENCFWLVAPFVLDAEHLTTGECKNGTHCCEWDCSHSMHGKRHVSDRGAAGPIYAEAVLWAYKLWLWTVWTLHLVILLRCLLQAVLHLVWTETQAPFTQDAWGVPHPMWTGPNFVSQMYAVLWPLHWSFVGLAHESVGNWHRPQNIQLLLVDWKHFKKLDVWQEKTHVGFEESQALLFFFWLKIKIMSHVWEISKGCSHIFADQSTL